MNTYRAIKEQFDSMIAHGDPEAYKTFFETISPENADNLYKEVVGELNYSSEVKRLANAYSQMSPSAAAEALTTMLTTNTDMVVEICQTLSVRTLAAILEEMDAGDVAVLTRLMYPDEPPARAVTVTAPDLPDFTPTAPPATETPPEEQPTEEQPPEEQPPEETP
jgi:hypothetical protein